VIGCPYLNAHRNPCPPHEPDDLFCAQCGRDLSEVASGATTDSATAATAAAPPSAPAPEAEAKQEEPKAPPPNYDVDNARPFIPDCCPNCHTPTTRETFDEDGFCTKCWTQTLLPGRDDFIIDNLGEKLLARSNRGTRHPRNEDYAALDSVEVGGKKIVWLIVCDGLSTSKNPQKASEAACKAASRVLRIAALSGQEGSEALIKRCIEAAQTAVVAVPPELNADPEDSPPATTITVAYIKDGAAYLGWCGDSRIYAIYKDGDSFKDKVLTRDHTLLNEKIDLEGITLEEAIKQFSIKELHTMVQCLGEVPEGETFVPSFTTLKIDASLACLFACSDGAWNDVHPMDAPESGLYGPMFKATGGNPKAFADAVLAKASGDDNNTIALAVF
jgi:serine/threonine protein phosphatase PrpC